MGNDQKILGGDFNLVLNDDLDRKGNRPHAHVMASRFVNSYMSGENFIDI